MKYRLGRTGLLAAAVAALLGGPAHSDPVAGGTCPAGSDPVEPIRDHLPVDQSYSDRDLARFALPYALMISDAERRWRYHLAPYGFIRGEDSSKVFAEIRGGATIRQAATGFYGTTFFHCEEKAIVVVFRSVDFYDVRDFLGALDRQIGSGESGEALLFFDAIRERYPDYSISVAGHSAAGALASWVGAVRSVPSVVFDATRTDAALLNDGSDQLVVIMEGDVLSDPDATAPGGFLRMIETLTDVDGALAGTQLKIDPVAEPVILLQLHWSGFMVKELTTLSQ